MDEVLSGSKLDFGDAVAFHGLKRWHLNTSGAQKIQGEHDFLIVLSRWRAIVCLECKANPKKGGDGVKQARKAFLMLKDFLDFSSAQGQWHFFKCFGIGEGDREAVDNEDALEKKLCKKCRPFFLRREREIEGALAAVRK